MHIRLGDDGDLHLKREEVNGGYRVVLMDESLGRVTFGDGPEGPLTRDASNAVVEQLRQEAQAGDFSLHEDGEFLRQKINFQNLT